MRIFLDGVILIFNNYTGDRLNFGLAMERAKADGKKVMILPDCYLSSIMFRNTLMLCSINCSYV